MNTSGNTIILTSNEEWGDMWFSKQHYAHELAAMGNEVYFINPAEKWKPANLFSTGLKVQEVEKGLFTVDYKNNVPSLGGKLQRINDFLLSLKLYNRLGNKKPLVFWLFDPFRLIFLHFFTGYYKIFHVVDDYSNHTRDLKLAASSDLIIVTSPFSIKRYESVNPEIIHIPHGISEEDKIPDILEVERLKNEWKDYVIYVGGINKHLNYPMLTELANRIKPRNLIFLGKILQPDSEKDKKLMQEFFKLENVHHLGLVHAKKLKNYIAAAKVAIIPYYGHEKSRGQTLKAINYLTQLTPFVAVELEDLKPFAENYIFMTNQNEPFIQHVQEILNNEKVIDPKKAKDYRERISYSNLIKKIFKKINEKQ